MNTRVKLKRTLQVNRSKWRVVHFGLWIVIEVLAANDLQDKAQQNFTSAMIEKKY
jgi:hypothetical protein